MYKRKVNDRWSFKEANTKEFTHCYHTYPAMMIPQIARTLIEEYKPKGRLELILDPYMGSGTTLVEASLAGVNSIGTDLNPLARLMGKVKTTHYNYKSILKQFRDIQSELIFYTEDKVKERNFDRISNYSFWYNEDNLLKLSYISQLIKDVMDKDFFNIALSEVVREVSFTRNGEFKRYRMNEVQIAKFNPDTFTLFEKKVLRNIEGLKNYTSRVKDNVKASIYDFNTMYGIPKDIIKESDVDMVVTSPPYGDSRTTVAYGQFSRWANEWFNFDNAKNLDNLLMGGKKATEEIFKTTSIRDVLDEINGLEHKRYLEVVSFLNDYYQSIENVAKTVRSGGTVCYVVGDRRVKGVQISLDYFTAEMFEKFGFKHKITIVRGIPNKRMPALTSPSNKVGAKVSTMSHEYIVILNKL
ncbi:TRM11 family SAM-dependent methyltransferase [Prevotella koreensis]